MFFSVSTCTSSLRWLQLLMRYAIEASERARKPDVASLSLSLWERTNVERARWCRGEIGEIDEIVCDWENCRRENYRWMKGTLLIPSASNYVGLSSLRFFIRTKRKRRERETTKQASARLALRDCPISVVVRLFLPSCFPSVDFSLSLHFVFHISRQCRPFYRSEERTCDYIKSACLEEQFYNCTWFPFLHNKTAKRRLVEFLFRFRDGTSREVLTTKFL